MGYFSSTAILHQQQAWNFFIFFFNFDFRCRAHIIISSQMKCELFLIQEFSAVPQICFLPLIGPSETRRNVFKKLVRWIQKNLRNIIFYRCYESSKTCKSHTFLVSFIIPLSWPERIMFYFLTHCKMFLKITHQREARPGAV